MFRQRRAAVHARDDPDERDADLHGGEKARGFSRQGHGDAGAGVACLGEFAETRFLRSDESHLRRGKNAVDQDERDNDAQFECDVGHNSIMAAREQEWNRRLVAQFALPLPGNNASKASLKAVGWSSVANRLPRYSADPGSEWLECFYSRAFSTIHPMAREPLKDSG